jgi:hypothetical protein
MDYKSYRQKYFADPAPPPRYRFQGSFGMTLYYQDFASAVAYYGMVLGAPGYLEGDGKLCIIPI